MSRTVLATALATLLAGLSYGCASGEASLLLENAGPRRVGLAGQRLGDTRTAVLASLAKPSADPPRCTPARLAPLAVRKAVLLERCLHAPDALAAAQRTFAGRSVTQLVTHFVDGRLVRLDARLALPPGGDPDAITAPRARLDERFGQSEEAVVSGETSSAGASSADVHQPAGVHRWMAGGDLVVLAPGRLSLLDARVTARLPGLADEPPGN